MTRLHNYGVPDERRSALVDHSPLGELVSSFGIDERQDGVSSLGAQLLEALNGVSPERGYEVLADYVVTRTEDMVTARYGYGDLGDDLIQSVTNYGFLSLSPISGHKTVGSWLTAEIEREAEFQGGAEVVVEVERLLSGNQSGVGIDHWLDSEFFRRHLLRTQNEPAVWHFVSESHLVSLLLPARRMTTDQFEALRAEVVGKTVDELERNRKAALTRPNIEQAAEYEQRIWEVRAFESDLKAALYRDTKRGRGSVWKPDWTNGTRANLAPFQQQGLLPFDVLSDAEVSLLAPTAS